MQIFAHRGILQDYPENSKIALEKALEAGFGIETDLRLTKDNDFIIIHDDNFKRLTGKDIPAASLTLNEAVNLQYTGSKEKIISLKDYLEIFNKSDNSLLTAVHLKADAQNETGLKKLVDYWKSYDLYERAFVFDLTTEAAEKLKAIDSKIKIALIISEYKFEPTIYLWNDVKEFPFFDIVWAAEYRNFYNPDLFSEMKKIKESVYAMSPDVHTALGHPLAYEGYKDTWRKILRWDIDGICTDKPYELKEEINKL